MTIETNPSETVEKRKRGRPPGSKNKSNGDPRDTEIANLRDQLAAMAKGQALAATLAPIPAATPDLPPGTYFQIGVDGNGAPIMGKVPHTRAWLIEHSPAVRWIPSRTTTVAPHGIVFSLEAGVEIETPEIVRGIFEESLEAERLEALRHRPLSLQEKSDLDNRAAATPGRHWSRSYKLAQTGLNVRDTDSGEEGI